MPFATGLSAVLPTEAGGFIFVAQAWDGAVDDTGAALPTPDCDGQACAAIYGASASGVVDWRVVFRTGLVLLGSGQEVRIDGVDMAAVVDADALARAAARAAAKDARFEVVAEVEVADALDFEATRQACSDKGGRGAESCAVQVAGALDARCVLFMRLGHDGAHSTLALTLTDVTAAAVVGRAAPDDAAGSLDDAVAAAVPPLLAEVTAPEQARLFIARVEGDAAAPAPAGPNLVLVGSGAAAGAVGVVAAVVSVVAVSDARGVLTDVDTSGVAKERAEGQQLIAGIAGVAGAVLAAAGAGLVVWGFAE